MYGLVFSVMLLSIAVWQTTVQVAKQQAQYVQAVSMAAANNFWAYRSAVVTYFYNHPAATGTIADASLTFPVGYVRNPAWTNIISGGTLYTYSTGTVPYAEVSAIAQRGGNSMMIGVAAAGSMTSLSGAATGFTLPAAISTGSVVVVGS